jgi:tetratricopeptide (TPR) repeat protein
MRGKSFIFIAYKSLGFVVVFFLFACGSSKKLERSTGMASKSKQSFDEVKFKHLFFEASKEKITNNFEKAFSLYKQALAVNPSSDAVFYELANISRSFGKYDQSTDYAINAKTLEPKNEWYRLLLIDNYHALGNYKQSSEEAKELVKQFPDNKNYYLTAAQELLFAKNLQASLEMYNACLKKFGPDENIDYNKIQLLMDLRQYKDAEALAVKVFREFPREKKFFNLLEEIYKFTNQKGKALELLEAQSKQNPEDPYLHLTLADYYRQEKQEEKAFKEISIAFESPDLPQSEKIKILLSFYNMTEKFPSYTPQAITLCQKLINQNPNDGKAHAIYGDFLLRDQKFEEAIKQYNMAVETEKDNYFLWSQLLILEAQQNKVSDLEKHASEALELFPSQPSPYYFKGYALSIQKKYQPAIEALNEGKSYVVENNALSLQFLGLLGDCYHAVKDYQNSDRSYDEALLIDADNEYVLNNYAYYLSLRKDKLVKAEKMSKRTLELQPENTNYLDTYAWILFQQGQYQEAKNYLDKVVLTKNEGSAIVLEHYGDIMFKLNLMSDAIKYWDLASKKGGASTLIGKKLKDKMYYE